VKCPRPDAQFCLIDLVQEDVEVTVSCRSEIVWGLDRIDSAIRNSEYAPSSLGCGATVFVIDTGIYAGHSEFDYGNRVVGSYSAIEGVSANDGHGHGTHCAGSVAGKTYGVAPGANLYGVKVLSDSGSGTGADVIEGQCSCIHVALDVSEELLEHDCLLETGMQHVGTMCPGGYYQGTRCVASMSLGGGYSSTENNVVKVCTRVPSIGK
jgi:hypothetical protein